MHKYLFVFSIIFLLCFSGCERVGGEAQSDNEEVCYTEYPEYDQLLQTLNVSEENTRLFVDRGLLLYDSGQEGQRTIDVGDTVLEVCAEDPFLEIRNMSYDGKWEIEYLKADISSYFTEDTTHYGVNNIFFGETEGRIYIVLDNLDAETYDALFVAVPISIPEQYVIWSCSDPAEGGGEWLESAYMIGNTIYQPYYDGLWAVDISTQKKYNCSREKALAEEAVQSFLLQYTDKTKSGEMFFCNWNAVCQTEDIVIYSADFREASDLPEVAVVYFAFQGEKLIDFLIADTASANLSSTEEKEN